LPLSDAHRAEVLAALSGGQAVGVQLDSISREVFPLPTPGLELERLAGDVAHGRGFALVQGVPVDAARTAVETDLATLSPRTRRSYDAAPGPPAARRRRLARVELVRRRRRGH
jgi:hypothetical protein